MIVSNPRGHVSYLVEIGLEEVNLLGGLEETGPELFLELLFPQNQFNLAVAVVHLGVLGVDLSVQIQGNLVPNTLLGITGKRDIGRGNVEGGLRAVHIGSLNAHVEIIALGIRVRRALGPCDCKKEIKLANIGAIRKG
jgi:hypothetical protein